MRRLDGTAVRLRQRLAFEADAARNDVGVTYDALIASLAPIPSEPKEKQKQVDEVEVQRQRADNRV